MKTLETRIAKIEASVFPEKEGAHIVYVVHERDSELEQETIREKAIAEYEQLHGVEVDPENADYVRVVIVGGGKR